MMKMFVLLLIISLALSDLLPETRAGYSLGNGAIRTGNGFSYVFGRDGGDTSLTRTTSPSIITLRKNELTGNVANLRTGDVVTLNGIRYVAVRTADLPNNNGNIRSGATVTNFGNVGGNSKTVVLNDNQVGTRFGLNDGQTVFVGDQSRPVTQTVVVDQPAQQTVFVSDNIRTGNTAVSGNDAVIIDNAGSSVSSSSSVQLDPVVVQPQTVSVPLTTTVVQNTSPIFTGTKSGESVIRQGSDYNTNVIRGGSIISEVLPTETVIRQGSDYNTNVIRDGSGIINEVLPTGTVIRQGSDYNTNVIRGGAITEVLPTETVIRQGSDFNTNVIRQGSDYNTNVIRQGSDFNTNVIRQGSDYNTNVVRTELVSDVTPTRTIIRQGGDYIPTPVRTVISPVSGYDSGNPLIITQVNRQNDGLFKNEIPGSAGRDYPLFTRVQNANFRCQDVPYAGYYADEQYQCQVYHRCHGNRRSTFTCPIGTLFNQETLVCDWWFNVNCANSRFFYQKNADIGVTPIRTSQQFVTGTNNIRLVSVDSSGSQLTNVSPNRIITQLKSSDY